MTEKVLWILFSKKFQNCSYNLLAEVKNYVRQVGETWNFVLVSSLTPLFDPQKKKKSTELTYHDAK